MRIDKMLMLKLDEPQKTKSRIQIENALLSRKRKKKYFQESLFPVGTAVIAFC